MLKKLALHLHSIKNKFYPLSYQTGATKLDSWIDIRGGIGNLFTNASLGDNFLTYLIMLKEMLHHYQKWHLHRTSHNGSKTRCDMLQLSNMGMLEKIAVNLMAGVPAVVNLLR